MAANKSIPFDALIFDLDGTLIDSAPDVCASINRVLVADGRPALTLEETTDMIGWGGQVLVEKALAHTGAPNTQADIDAAFHKFLDIYAAQPVDNTTVYPGVIEALDQFKADGIALGLCTNKPRAATLPVLEGLGLDGYFSAMACGDDVEHKKPDSRHVLHVIEALGIDKDATAMIGDSENDISAAINAGIKSVAVTFGYVHVPHSELGADMLIDHFKDLPRALEDIAGPRAFPVH